MAPAIAKSPWRRANSWKPNPLRGPHTGKPTAVRTSPGASDVSHRPVKKSAAGIRRVAVVDVASISASSVNATVGNSPAGSPWATAPPSVPRLRIWKWPMCGATRVSRGTARATSASLPTTEWVVAALTQTVSPRTSMPLSSSIWEMSMRFSKWVNRRANSAVRLCPPARILPSSP